jgi:hypothetical protein
MFGYPEIELTVGLTLAAIAFFWGKGYLKRNYPQVFGE